MKPFLTFFALISVVVSNAQSKELKCDEAQSSVQIGQMVKGGYEGSVCFTGSGVLEKELSVTNWPWLNIATDDTILVNTPIQFSAANAKVFSTGNVRFTDISMDGGDTLFVKSGLCTIDAITSENSMPSGWNTIVLDDGAELYWAGTLFTAGNAPATIATGGVRGSKIKIISANEHAVGLNYRD